MMRSKITLAGLALHLLFVPGFVQAGWAWLQRDNNFCVSGQIDPLEGWIADPSLHKHRP